MTLISLTDAHKKKQKNIQRINNSQMFSIICYPMNTNTQTPPV